MTRLIETWRRLAMWLRRGRLERELEEEMRLHLELRAREHEDRGLPPAEARQAAQRGFGNATLQREDSRAQWGWRWLESLGQDLRYALRTMRRSPGFTSVAVLALALGIGANTAIFSVVNAVLLQPLAYEDADELVTILHDGARPVSPPNYLDWRAQAGSFAGMGAAEYLTPNLGGAGATEQIAALRVTADLFPLLGVPPRLGRTFVAGEDQAGRDKVVILGHELWQKRFGGDPAIVGRQIALSGVSHTVVGLMPRGFRFAPFWATDAELWVPLAFGDTATQRSRQSLRVFARLRPGVTLERARAEMAAITARLDREFPGSNRNVVVTPLKEKVVGSVRPALLVLLGAVGFVLLVACANVAHMLLARAAARQREIALRTALGAGRARLVRQFLTESILLALIGGGAGLLLAAAGVDALVALGSADVPRMDTVTIDGGVLAVTLAVSLAAGVAFGLLPALHAAGPDVHAALKEGGARVTDGGDKTRLRGLLVASQVALALVLTVGAGLMIRSFVALRGHDPGLRAENLLTAVVSVAGTKEAATDRRAPFYAQLIDKVAALPGVASVSAVNHLPLAGDIWGFAVFAEGQPIPRPGEARSATYRVVVPGYFRTMGISLVRGRDVADSDRLDTPAVVVVNERLAATLWPGEDPLGKRLTTNDPQAPDSWATVVGVVADVVQNEWTGPPEPELYMPYWQSRRYLESPGSHLEYLTLVVRTRVEPATLTAPIRAAVAAMDEGVAVSHVSTMEDVVAQANARARFLLLVLGAFAGVALLLSAVGVYGVMSHAVSRRTHEIGVRMALGATRRDVVRLVVGQGTPFVLGGVAVGLAGALALSRILSTLLYGVGATDPLTFVAVPLVLCAVALAASYIPARRAARVDPVLALRND